MRRTAIGSVLLVLAAAAANAAEPTPAALAKAGAAAQERFAKDAVRWNALLQTGQLALEVEVVGRQTQWRREMRVEVQGRRALICRIIERDGFWFVEDETGFHKYRPHEAVFSSDTFYMFYHLAQPRFIVDPEVELGKFVSESKGRAQFISPLPPAQREQLLKAKRAYDELNEKSPGIIERPDVKQGYETVTRLLEHGIEIEVDVPNGMLAASGDLNKRTRIARFEWLDEVPRGAFDIADKKWADHTDNLLAGDPNDLALMDHDPLWRPGPRARQVNPGLVLVNLRTHAMHRVPAPMPITGGGCFTRDRKHAIIGVMDISSGVISLADVNLATGETRILGGELLQRGHTLMPALSPDGKTVAALHMPPDAPMLQAQVVLIDLASGEARALGKPMDTAYLSWLPDQSGLILVHRVLREGQEFTDDSVARMDLAGKVTILCRGDQPLVLPRHNAILFREDNNDERRWQLCDLDGSNPRRFGDGLKSFGAASLRPGGDQLLMDRFSPETGPVPHVVDVASGKASAIDLGSGFWRSAER